MQIVFDIINPSNIVTNEEIKSVLSAVICHEIYLGRQFPGVFHVRLVKSVIRRDNAKRTGELKFTNGNPDHHVIRAVYGDRTRDQILLSIFHEASHLVRAYNDTNSLDSAIEEEGNSEQMKKMANAVEWISSILIVNSDGNLKSMYDKPGLE